MIKYSTLVIASALILSACNQSQQIDETSPTDVVPAIYADNRIIFDLNAAEREHFIEEMHNYMAAIEGVIMGLSENDMGKVAEAAYKVTPRGHTRPDPALRESIHSKIQPEFQTMNRSVRKGFQKIYEQAKADGNAGEIQALLGETLQVCSACHSAYQVPTK